MAGYTAAQAIALIRNRTDEQTFPNDTVIQSFLNAGIIQIANELGPVISESNIALTPGQIIVTFPTDLMDVLSASYSTSLPETAGTIVYPLTQMDQRQFMDFTGGLPTVGFGPCLAYFVNTDASGVQTAQVYPAAGGGANANGGGYFNLYYRARPTPYLDTAMSLTNIDPMAQEPMILWAMIETLRNRGRVDDIPPIEARYDAEMDKTKTQIRRRTQPKSSSVRDIMSVGNPAFPPWTRW